VAYWHEADIGELTADVCFRGESGPGSEQVLKSSFDPKQILGALHQSVGEFKREDLIWWIKLI
jgi:hypothetical protein